MEHQAVGPRTSPLVQGSVIGGWQVVRRLGGGGMAEIYLAQHPRIPRLDVLKVMRSWLADDARFRERFHAEAERISSLSHPNVITIYDQGEDAGRLYLVMQHAPGGDLRAVLQQEGRLPVGRAMDIATQLASALDAGHEIGLVHRDVKPDNVLLDAPHTGYPDRVLLCDFGISTLLDSSTHLTQTGELLVSPAYAAPEQFEEKPIDGRTDQYSLACLLFELLTGSPPFSAPTIVAAYKAHVLDPIPSLPPELGLPSGLNAALRRALSKQSSERFETCRAFLAAAAGPVPPLPVPPAPRAAPDATPETGAPSAELDPPTTVLPITKAQRSSFHSAPSSAPPTRAFVEDALAPLPGEQFADPVLGGWEETSPERATPWSSRAPLLESAFLCLLAVGLALTSLLPWFASSSRSDSITPWDAYSLRYFVGGGPGSFHIEALGDRPLGPYVLLAAVLLFGAALWRGGPRWGALLALLLAAGCLWSLALFSTDGDPAARVQPGLSVAAGLCGAYVVGGLSAAAARRRRQVSGRR